MSGRVGGRVATPHPQVEEVDDDGEVIERQRSDEESRHSTPESEDTAVAQRLEEARVRNRRLKQRRELSALEAENEELQYSRSRSTIGSPVGSVRELRPLDAAAEPAHAVNVAGSEIPTRLMTPTYGAPANPLLPNQKPWVPKSFRPDNMRSYKGTSEGEHLRWFADLKKKFLKSPEYFTTELSRIVYCMDALEDNPNTQWNTYINDHGWSTVTFGFFERFLHDLVADPINRRLLAYERFEEAKQRSDQKVTVFKAYLEELEANLPPMASELKANLFLAKLRPELKNKILSTGRVSDNREDIVAQAIMQENTMGRERRGGGGSNTHSKTANQGSSTQTKSQGSRSLESRITNPNKSGSKGKGGPPAQPQSGANSKRKGDTEQQPGIVCWHCGKPGHKIPECPNKDKPATYTGVGAVSGKEQTPPKPQKRSRKDAK